ncbi:MAG: hypothetical protein ACK45V_12355, partial [Brevundimonas sp.]
MARKPSPIETALERAIDPLANALKRSTRAPVAPTVAGAGVAGQISFFAPSALPTGVTGQQVINQYAPGTNIA